MRRLTRLIDALGSPAGVAVLSTLLEGPRSLEQLRSALEKQEIASTPSTLSALLLRFEDLGVVERDNRKAPYNLLHRDAVAAALLHLASLGLAMAGSEETEAKDLEQLSRRTRLKGLGNPARSKSRSS
jgi:DNA-binding transcriptional ArsR family regulator